MKVHDLFDKESLCRKQCTKYREVKPFTEFHTDKRKCLNISAKCKQCSLKRPESGEKKCSICEKTKDISRFCRDRRRADGLSRWCRSCGKKRMGQHRQMMKEDGTADDAYREDNIRRKGITLEEYNAMMEAQNHVCKICREPESVRYKGKRGQGKKKALYVDHDHKTGKIRDLLCHRCNIGLGHFRDNPKLLRRAANYLERHSRIS